VATHWNRIIERTTDDVVILEVWGGPLSVSDSGDRLLKKIQDVVEQGWRRILLNLSEVQYVDSVGLGEVVQGTRTVRDAGGHLAVCGLVKQMRALFSTTKLETVIPVFRSEQEGVDGLARL